MNYAPITIPGLAPDEVGYQIEGGQCAAVRMTRSAGAAPHMFGFTACAFAVELDGSPTLTAAMQTIEGWHTVSCSKADLLVDGVLSQQKVDDMKALATLGSLTDIASAVAAEQAFAELSI